MIKVQAVPHFCFVTKQVQLKIHFNDEIYYFPTGVLLSPEEFDVLQKEDKLDYDVKLRLANQEIERSKKIFENIVAVSETPTIENIAPLYAKRKKAPTLFKLFERVIKQKKKQGAIPTAEAYMASLSSFQKLLNYRDYPLEKINSTCLNKWFTKLKSQNIAYNTVIFHWRNLRSLLTLHCKKLKFAVLFEKYNLKQQRTVKRALSTEDVQFLLNYDVSHKGNLQRAKDFFVISLLLRGMPLIDLVYLKKNRVYEDYILYERHKTGALLQVKILPCVKELLNKYRANENSSYFLKILDDKESEVLTFKRYRNFLRTHNRNLNKLGELLDFPIPLSSYVARHTWATQAKYIGTTVALISEALGHSKEDVTYTYLKEFDTDILDEVNYNVYQHFLQ